MTLDESRLAKHRAAAVYRGRDEPIAIVRSSREDAGRDPGGGSSRKSDEPWELRRLDVKDTIFTAGWLYSVSTRSSGPLDPPEKDRRDEVDETETDLPRGS